MRRFVVSGAFLQSGLATRDFDGIAKYTGIAKSVGSLEPL